MPKRPSDKQMALLRKRHALRAIRETKGFQLGWPEQASLLDGMWFLFILRANHDFGRSDWIGWIMMLGNKQCPRLSFDPFEPY